MEADFSNNRIKELRIERGLSQRACREEGNKAGEYFPLGSGYCRSERSRLLATRGIFLHEHRLSRRKKRILIGVGKVSEQANENSRFGFPYNKFRLPII